MRILLDTHVLVWVLLEPDRLSGDDRTAIEEAADEVLFSAVNIWEIAIKAQLGRPGFVFDAGEIARTAIGSGFIELAVRSDAAARVGRLPLLHRDPFDRLLVAQALVEPALLYTADRDLAPYSELVQVIRPL